VALRVERCVTLYVCPLCPIKGPGDEFACAVVDELPQDVTLADMQYATQDPESETDHDNDRV
jgi:hypothetical protein